MTPAQQQYRLVALGSIAVMAVYFPVALYLGHIYVPDKAPPPPGAVRYIFNLEKYSVDGIGFLEKAVGYRFQPGLVIYEDDRRLTPSTSLGEVDSTPGRFAQETGIGIIVSATDGSNIQASNNKFRYWVVKPDAPR